MADFLILRRLTALPRLSASSAEFRVETGIIFGAAGVARRPQTAAGAAAAARAAAAETAEAQAQAQQVQQEQQKPCCPGRASRGGTGRS